MDNKRDRSNYEREYYLKNRKRLREQQEQYYTQNKEKLQEEHRSYYQTNREKILLERATSKKGRYKNYIWNAKTRGYAFELTYDQFITFWQLPCYYCKQSVDTIGLDRLDNAQDYSLANVVPCCTSCNKAKLEMTAAQFIFLCKRVATNH